MRSGDSDVTDRIGRTFETGDIVEADLRVFSSRFEEKNDP